MDIIEKLDDLLKQAQTEKSHFYVASVCREAMEEIQELRGRPTREAYDAVCKAYWKRVG
jgi:hypothetical protein